MMGEVSVSLTTILYLLNDKSNTPNINILIFFLLGSESELVNLQKQTQIFVRRPDVLSVLSLSFLFFFCHIL